VTTEGAPIAVPFGPYPQHQRLANQRLHQQIPRYGISPDTVNIDEEYLTESEVRTLWSTFLLGFLCILPWIFGAWAFATRAALDRRIHVRIPYIGNMLGTLVAFGGVLALMVWLIIPK